jgi:hypothetical protein
VELTPEKLEALLEILLKMGVSEFEGWGFHVQFKDTALPPERAPVELPQRSKVSQEAKYPPKGGVWDNPALWPDGRPPSFPSESE